ncbi:MAG: hypothetical protein ACFBSF_00075 [Leptolyngbyaceae cyanobacterium]
MSLSPAEDHGFNQASPSVNRGCCIVVEGNSPTGILAIPAVNAITQPTYR